MINGLVTCFLAIFLFFLPTILIASEEHLALRAKNPLTNLLQLQFENDINFTNYGSSDSSNDFYIKPIIPITDTPFPQLMRFKVLMTTLAKTATTTPKTVLSDTQYFDLLIFEEPWGRWGIGPVMMFPTATSTAGGAGKWQIGPAIGFSYMALPTYNFGFLALNPISFAGNRDRPAVNTQLFQPFITKHFEEGWYFSFNPTWIIQWNARNVQIPLNFGFGRVVDVGGVKLDMTLQWQFIAYKNCPCVVPNQTLQISLAILFN